MKSFLKPRYLGPIPSLIILAIAFNAMAYILWRFLYSSEVPFVLGIIALFVLIGCLALVGLVFTFSEKSQSTAEFYPIEEQRGTPAIQSLAEKLAQRLSGSNYYVETNAEGIRIAHELSFVEEERLKAGDTLYTDGCVLAASQSGNQYKPINISMKYQQKNGQYQIKPIYVGGKLRVISKATVVEMNESGVHKTSLPTAGTLLLADVLKESQRHDGWKSKMDVVTLIGIVAATIGILVALGAILMGFFIDK